MDLRCRRHCHTGGPRRSLRRVHPALLSSGYLLNRGKLCRLDGRLFLHLVYTDGSHTFSLYLRPENGRAVPVATADLNGKHLGCSENGEIMAVVVTNESPSAARALAAFAGAAL